MLYLILDWFLSAGSLLLAAYLVPGFRITSLDSALIAVTAAGLCAASLGTVLRDVDTRLGVVLAACFLFVVNVFVFRLSALLVPGFAMLGFLPAVAGAAALQAVEFGLRAIPDRALFDSERSWLKL